MLALATEIDLQDVTRSTEGTPCLQWSEGVHLIDPYQEVALRGVNGVIEQSESFPCGQKIRLGRSIILRIAKAATSIGSVHELRRHRLGCEV